MNSCQRARGFGLVALQVLADPGVEPNEAVIVTLSAASPGVTITKTIGTLTFLNDD